jgi:hypothetical protein
MSAVASVSRSAQPVLSKQEKAEQVVAQYKAEKAAIQKHLDKDKNGSVSRADFVKFLQSSKKTEDGKEVKGLSAEDANKLADKVFKKKDKLSVDDLQKTLKTQRTAEAQKTAQAQTKNPSAAVQGPAQTNQAQFQKPAGGNNALVNVLA